MYHFHIGLKEEAKQLIEKYHYSGKMPTGVQFVGTFHRNGGLFGDQGECVAACVITGTARKWNGLCLELSRLVRKEGVEVSLSSLISKTCKEIKRRELIDLIVSYADTSKGHHGGIYQAASWIYNGQRDSYFDGVYINGEFITAFALSKRYKSRSIKKAREVFGDSAEYHFDGGKHLYWKPLNKRGRRNAKKMNLKEVPYPKPDR